MMCVFLCCVGSCDVCVHVLCELIVVCGILYCSSFTHCARWNHYYACKEINSKKSVLVRCVCGLALNVFKQS